MAITRTASGTTLTIKIESGVSASGGTVYANRNISKINPSIADTDAYDVASSIGSLQSAPVGDILRTDKFSLSRE